VLDVRCHLLDASSVVRQILSSMAVVYCGKSRIYALVDLDVCTVIIHSCLQIFVCASSAKDTSRSDVANCFTEPLSDQV
jgi:hypothetical protein